MSDYEDQPPATAGGSDYANHLDNLAFFT